MTHYPTPEQVAATWLSTVPSMPLNKVATTLPADVSTWADTGFVTVTTVGGSPKSIHVPVREPVIQIDVWAANPNSPKPPWGRAGSLMQAIVDFTYYTEQPGVLYIRPGFYQVRVMSVFPIVEPRRIPGDEAGFARYQMDMAFSYALAAAA